MPLRLRHTYAAVLQRGLPADDFYRHGSSPIQMRVRAAAQPISAGFELVGILRGVLPLVSVRTPSRLACRTRTIWRCWPVPSLSGLLSALPPASEVRLPPASPDRCDGPAAVPLHHRTVSWRLVAHEVEHPDRVRLPGRPLRPRRPRQGLPAGGGRQPHPRCLQHPQDGRLRDVHSTQP